MTDYNANGEELFWSISYMLNGRGVRHVNSDGFEVNSKYDSHGRVIQQIFENTSVSYSYNSNNNVIERRHYTGSSLEYYYVFNYINLLLQNTYKIDASGDTIYYKYYYYGNDNVLDSTITADEKTFFYYAENADSSFTYSHQMNLIKKVNNFYQDSVKVFYKIEKFNVEITERRIITWEYDNGGYNLLEYTSDYINYEMNTDEYEKKVYNYNIDNIERIDYFDRSNNLVKYDHFLYVDYFLEEKRTYDASDNILYYRIYESSCGITIADY